MTQKINKSAHSLSRMSKQTSGTKDDKDTGSHQARPSSPPKICIYILRSPSHIQETVQAPTDGP